MAKNALLTVGLTVNDQNTAVFDASPTWKGVIEAALAFASGTGAGQFDLAYVAERTVADGADDDLDLAGSLTDAFGNTITAAELVLVAVINKPKTPTDDPNTTDLTIGGGSNPFVGFLGGTTPTIGPIKPGGIFLLAASDAAGIGTVTASTADILRITNSAGAAATYQIAILARSA